MDDLWDKKLDEAAKYIGPVHVDELWKFVGYVPYMDLDVTC